MPKRRIFPLFKIIWTYLCFSFFCFFAQPKHDHSLLTGTGIAQWSWGGDVRTFALSLMVLGWRLNAINEVKEANCWPYTEEENEGRKTNVIEKARKGHWQTEVVGNYLIIFVIVKLLVHWIYYTSRNRHIYFLSTTLLGVFKNRLMHI